MNELKFESIWFDQHKFEEAECLMYKSPKTCVDGQSSSSIVSQITKARETIQQTLKGETKGYGTASPDQNVDKRLETLEAENKTLKETIKKIQENFKKLEQRVNNIDVPGSTSKPQEPTKEESEEEDSDSDLFGSDDDEEATKAAEERKKAFAEAKKSKKPAIIAKSNIILEVKPWDDETDMAELEKKVRSVQKDGLLWGSSKLVPVGYGIKKLQISCVVEDDKVGTEDLEEAIIQFEDHVQSVDIAAFNKV